MPTERKKKCFQVEVSISHKDPSMPVRRVASTHSLDYESWPSAASRIAAVIWAKAQKDLFAESAEATIEKVIIFNLFRMPLPNGDMHFSPDKTVHVFRWPRYEGETCQTIEDFLAAVIKTERRSSTGLTMIHQTHKAS